MIRLDSSHTDVALVSNPGIIRNFRVQVRECGSNDWHMYSTFRLRSEAQTCVNALQFDGIAARMVDCDRCPTAI